MNLSIEDRCWAEIDLGIVKRNIQGLRRSADFMAVVKANAYGHGAVPVAKAAIDAGATWLGVAIPEEGIELREAGIVTPILILSEPFNLNNVDEYNLTPVVYTRKTINDLPWGCPVHLKVDTGMHRVGCQPAESSSLINLINRRGLRLQGFMTHLAGTNDSKQLALFDSLIKELHIGSNVMVHAANSQAVQKGVGEYDMDRCGIAMYNGVMKLKSRVGLIRYVEAGEGISYENFRLPYSGYIGVIPIGYADGVPRRLREVGGTVSVNGEDASIISVTMDQTIIDLGWKTSVSVGDEVDLLIHEWPDSLSTISYEVLCGVRDRVPRQYSGGDDESGS